MITLSKRPSRRTAAVLAAGLAVAAGAGAATSATASTRTAAAPTGLHQVPAVLLGLSRATKLGAAPAGRSMDLTVSLTRPDVAGEDALYAAMQDEKSPLYRHFLTPAQFAARFGVPAATTKAAVTFLQVHGLHVTKVSPTGDLITLTGTPAQVDKTFAVTESVYRFKGTTFLANDKAPSVPAALPVAAVSGLDTFRTFATPTYSPQRQQKTGATPSKVPPTTSLDSYQGEFDPRDLWGQYDLPPDNLGQGQTAGLFGEGAPDQTVLNLRLFENAQKLPKVPVRTITTEGGGFQDYKDNAGNVEWYLDSQAITGMAPDLKRLDLYFAKTLFDPDIFASFKTWADDPIGPTQMNASFGECEADPSNPITGPLAQVPYGTELGDELESVAEPILKQAVMEGRQLFSSTGDTGSGCPELVVPVLGAGNGVAYQPVPIVNYPAASPYVVAAGGTVVTSDATKHSVRSDEQSWLFTGGGASHFIAEPAYQTKIANIDQLCYSQPDGTPFASVVPPICRGIPDLSALSGNVTGNGYNIIADSQVYPGGGTSLSSPLLAGMFSRVAAASKTPLGSVNDIVYKLGADPASYARDFHDITEAENGAPGNGAYTDGTGWDYVSGLGSPDISKIMMDALGHTAAVTTADPVEAAPLASCTSVTALSPTVNAADPLTTLVTPMYDPSVDLTTATLALSKDKKSLVATLKGAGLSATPPTNTTGEDFYLFWLQGTVRHYVVAHESTVNGESFSSGVATDSYTDAATSKATGTFPDGTLTITVPLSEVGNPSGGALLEYPYALTQIDTAPATPATNPLTFSVDAASHPTATTASSSRGQALQVGGVCARSVAAPTPIAAPRPVSTPTALPTTGLDGRVLVLPLVLLIGSGLFLRRRRV